MVGYVELGLYVIEGIYQFTALKIHVEVTTTYLKEDTLPRLTCRLSTPNQ